MNLLFTTELFKLVDELLKPENLKVKKIIGRELIGSEYFDYAKKCFDQFSSDELPETPSTYQAAIDTHMRKLVDSCFEEYKQNFDIIAQNDRNKVADNHPELMSKALNKYKESKKMGSEEFETIFRVKLEQKINDFYQSWCTRIEENKKKIEIARENMQKKIQEEQQYQLKIQNEMKKEVQEKLEMERKRRADFEFDRIKKYKQIPSRKFLKFILIVLF